MNVLEPLGVETRFVDICDLDAVEAAVEQRKPGCVLMETISNPLLRVGQVDRIAEIARRPRARRWSSTTRSRRRCWCVRWNSARTSWCTA